MNLLLNIDGESFEIEDTGLLMKDWEFWIRRTGFPTFMFIGEIKSGFIKLPPTLTRGVHQKDHFKNELNYHGDSYKKAIEKFYKLIIFE
jgi:hypothetical protein